MVFPIHILSGNSGTQFQKQNSHAFVACLCFRTGDDKTLDLIYVKHELFH